MCIVNGCTRYRLRNYIGRYEYYICTYYPYELPTRVFNTIIEYKTPCRTDLHNAPLDRFSVVVRELLLYVPTYYNAGLYVIGSCMYSWLGTEAGLAPHCVVSSYSSMRL